MLSVAVDIYPPRPIDLKTSYALDVFCYLTKAITWYQLCVDLRCRLWRGLSLKLTYADKDKSVASHQEIQLCKQWELEWDLKPLLRSQEYLTDTLILIIHQFPSIDGIIVVSIFEYQQGPWYLPDVRRGYLISININNAEFFMIIIIPPVTELTHSKMIAMNVENCVLCLSSLLILRTAIHHPFCPTIYEHLTQVDWCTRSLKVVNSVNSAKFETHKPWLSLSVDCISYSHPLLSQRSYQHMVTRRP